MSASKLFSVPVAGRSSESVHSGWIKRTFTTNRVSVDVSNGSWLPVVAKPDPSAFTLSAKWTSKRSVPQGIRASQVGTPLRTKVKLAAHTMEEIKEPEHCIVDPNHPGRGAWDIITLVLVVYDVIMMPLMFFELETHAFMDVASWVTRLFWTTDIPLTFWSGFVTRTGHVERNRGVIARQYLRTWFVIDLLIVVLDWIEVIIEAILSGHGVKMGRLGRLTRTFRMIRMLRLLRLAKINQIIAMLTEQCSSERLRVGISIFKYLTLMMISGHVLACLWYSTGSADAAVGWAAESECEVHSKSYCYVISLRWSLAQFGGGMDEFSPSTLSEHVFAVFAYLLAFWFGAALVSTLTSLITQLVIDGSDQNRQLGLLCRYLEQNKISKKLALRLTRNAKHVLTERRKMIHEDFVDIMQLVTEPLRMELRFEIYGPVVSAHPFFALYISACPYVTKRICHRAMSMMLVATGDLIFDAGEIPTNPRMYLVNNASLSYRHIGSDCSREVLLGSWVSEAVLWMAWTHRGVLCATKDCCLYTLDASEFQDIASHFEYSAEFDPNIYAEHFAGYLNSIDQQDVSDVMLSPEIRDFLVETPMSMGSIAKDGDSHRWVFGSVRIQ